MSEATNLQERIRGWADDLVDISGRSDLISFKTTKTRTITPDLKSVEKLLQGKSVLLSQIIDLELRENKTAARGVINEALNNYEQFGLEVLRLISGFATWTSQKVKVTNAPIVSYPLEVVNPESPISRKKLRLVQLEPEINPALILHLKKINGIELTEELFEEAQELGEEEVFKKLLEVCPDSLGLKINAQVNKKDYESKNKDGSEWMDQIEGEYEEEEEQNFYRIKNLRYQKFPMVNDLNTHINQCTKNKIISALAGDDTSINKLRNDIKITENSQIKEILPAQEFLTLDADSTQQSAINSALNGQNLVIEGPPGTGKSQTIANLISSLIANQKTVLFVAEKRPAIDAVKKRISHVDLDSFFLDLHSIKEIRKKPASIFVKALDQLNTIPYVDCTENDIQLKNTKEILSDRDIELVKIRSPWSCSYLDVLNLTFESKDFDGDPFIINNNEINKLNPTHFNDIKRLINNLYRLSPDIILSKTFPLFDSIISGKLERTEDVISFLSNVDQLETSLASIDDWANSIGIEKDKLFLNFENIDSIIRKINVLSRNIEVDVLSALSFSLSSLNSFKKTLGQNLVIKGVFYLADKQYREKLTAIEKTLLIDKKVTIRSIEKIEAVIKTNEDLREVGIDFKKVVDSTKDLMENLNLALSSLNEISKYISIVFDKSTQLNLIRSIIKEINSNRQLIPLAVSINEDILKLEQIGLSKDNLLASVISNLSKGFDSDSVYKRIISAWSIKVEEAIRISSSTLVKSTRDYLDELVEDFCESDSNHIQTTAQRIRRIVAEKADQCRRKYSLELDVLRRENIRTRGKMSARKLFSAAPNLVKALKPCWAMSPLVVSQLLPADKAFFDVVIFDEASQIVPHDAITSILRGSQLIVAGDSKQLSPTSTSFFGSSSEEDDYEDDENFNSINETESLLDAVKTVLPSEAGTKTLQWHYRSEDEKLIAFSNQHSGLYDSCLISAPTTTTKPPFEYHLVEGSFDEISGLSPKAEVERTIELVFNHLKNKPNESLALIAFGSTHAKKLQNKFDSLFEEDSSISLSPENKPDEKFLIRHLEAIQGNERDVIFLSTGYGPLKENKRRYNFGAFNRDENFFGLRRLNVAITRARKRVEVISTINPYEYELEKLNKVGQQALIEYLRLVKSGGTDFGVLFPNDATLTALEKDIYESLTSKGVILIPQYGVSGYKLSFAIQHPSKKNQFFMSLEIDSNNSNISTSIRDQYRIRHNHLRKMGWNIYKIWSTEWFLNKDKEIDLLLESINKFKIQRKKTSNKSQVNKPKKVIKKSSRKGIEPFLPSLESIDDYRGEIQEYILWICSDNLLYSDEQIFEEVFKKLPYSKRGRKIKDRLYSDIKYLRKTNQIS